MTEKELEEFLTPEEEDLHFEAEVLVKKKRISREAIQKTFSELIKWDKTKEDHFDLYKETHKNFYNQSIQELTENLKELTAMKVTMETQLASKK